MSHCLEDRCGATFGDGTNPSPLAVGRQPPWRAICLGKCPSIWIAGVATYDVSGYSQILSTHLYQENDGCVFWTMRYQVPYLQASVEWRIRNTCELNALLLFSPGGCMLCPGSHTKCRKVLVERYRRATHAVTDKRLYYKMRNSVTHYRKPHGNNERWHLRIWKPGSKSIMYFVCTSCFDQRSAENGSSKTTYRNIRTCKTTTTRREKEKRKRLRILDAVK